MEVPLSGCDVNEFNIFTDFSFAMIRKAEVDTQLLRRDESLSSIGLDKLFVKLPALRSIRMRTRFNREPMLTGTI
jgi:hypothetical protein